MKFDAKGSSLEGRKDLDSLTMDELHGILTTYEMKIGNENPSRREEAFKVLKGTKKKKHQSNESCIVKLDEEEANFVRKLKKGSNKYKGKLPFKCFNYGKIGHYSKRCPYLEKEDSNDEQDHKKRAKLETRKYSIRKVCTPKKKVAHLMRVMMMNLMFSLSA